LRTELTKPAGSGKNVLDTPSMFFDKIFKVNIVSHFVLIKEFLPGMLDMQKGHIVGIASMASFVAAPGLLDYCCTKVGVLYLNDGE
jgi:all-trans-retinol dehydrogenase (NAD+)